MSLTKDSRNSTINIEWSQMFRTKKQTYDVYTYMAQSNPVPVFIQSGYDAPTTLTVNHKLQYGSQEGVLFFVYHDKGQKPYQHRFNSGGLLKSLGKHGSDWIKSLTKGYVDFASWVGEYLHDV